MSNDMNICMDCVNNFFDKKKNRYFCADNKTRIEDVPCEFFEKRCDDDIDNPWHTGRPTELEQDNNWKWNYALVLHTAYDCIGNYLAGMFFMPDFEKNVFSAPLGNGKDLEVPFDDVIAWHRVEPYNGNQGKLEEISPNLEDA